MITQWSDFPKEPLTVIGYLTGTELRQMLRMIDVVRKVHA